MLYIIALIVFTLIGTVVVVEIANKFPMTFGDDEY
jgi:hypothetical protein